MENISDIKREALTVWLAEDGLMRIRGVDEDCPPYPGATMRTVGNDNGILWLCYTLWLLNQAGEMTSEDQSRFYETAIRLELPTRPGVYDRNPHRSGDRNALDNIIALGAGYILSNRIDPCVRIVAHLDTHGNTWSNVSDGIDTNPVSFMQWNISGMIRMGAGSPPTVVELAWILSAAKFQETQEIEADGKHWTEYALQLLILSSSFRRISEIYRPECVTPRMLIAQAYASFLKRVNDIGGLSKIFDGISQKAHPIVRLSKLLSLPDWREIERQALNPVTMESIGALIADVQSLLQQAQTAMDTALMSISEQENKLRLLNNEINASTKAVDDANARIGEIVTLLPELQERQSNLPQSIRALSDRIDTLADTIFDHMFQPTRSVVVPDPTWTDPFRTKTVTENFGPQIEVFVPNREKENKRNELQALKEQLNGVVEEIRKLHEERARLVSELPIMVAAKTVQEASRPAQVAAVEEAKPQVSVAQYFFSSLQEQLSRLETSRPTDPRSTD